MAKAAAQGADEADIEDEGPALQIGDDPALGQDGILHQKNGLIGGEPALIAQAGDIIGLFIALEGKPRILQATGEGMLAGGGVRHLAKGFCDRAIIGADRGFPIRLGAAQICAEVAAVEDRQGDGRAYGAEIRSRREKLAEVKRLLAHIAGDEGG